MGQPLELGQDTEVVGGHPQVWALRPGCLGQLPPLVAMGLPAKRWAQRWRMPPPMLCSSTLSTFRALTVTLGSLGSILFANEETEAAPFPSLSLCAHL